MSHRRRNGVPRHAVCSDRLHAAAMTLCVALVAGCSDGSLQPPDDPENTTRVPASAQWALMSIAGDPLPAIGRQDAGSTTFVQGDTLTFLVDSTVRQTGHERVRGSDPEQYVDFRIVNEYRAQFRGDTVALFVKCPRVALCSPGPSFVGQIAGERLTLQLAASGRRVPLVYRRLSTSTTLP
jgi:hypothetical protein